MYLLKLLYDKYIYFFETNSDPRMNDKFLMGSPIPVLIFIFLYLKFVLDWGQKFMKDRKPFEVDRLIILYNIIQIAWNLELFIKAFRYTYGLGGYSFTCQPVDTSTSGSAMIIADGVHSYVLIKFFDCLDTVFFVLRKKNKQITFLHVYHHAGVLALAWSACKVYPGGQTVFTGFLNTFIHVIMYSYYLYAVLNPNEKNIWWKKYLTQMQIVQFFLICACFTALIIVPDCGYPKWGAIFVVPQNLFLMIMFTDFYIKSYYRRKTN
ncbi:elongation of very long chain fatty acids protein 7-like [Condylostylus longicornis]|uniref:elongation of very long chain fatty acids protein 7-like n=1 Tax=Condylostylus longicornis TaxID=2530218 RepID=UPI00244E264C|nr:elongation of very long chain fatty acids protein 7-like [Condylostylus longicornis]